MPITKRILGLVATAAILVGGCKRSPSSDPKGTFENLAPKFIAKLGKQFATPITGSCKAWTLDDGHGGVLAECEPAPFSYTYNIGENYTVDVQKTESLMTPYIGIVRVNLIRLEHNGVKMRGEPMKFVNFKYEMEVAFHLALQDGSWVLKTARARQTDVTNPSSPAISEYDWFDTAKMPSDQPDPAIDRILAAFAECKRQ